MREEIKVVVILKGGKGSIGVQAPKCDPVLEVFEGGIETALERIPALVEKAETQWADNPLYPKCDFELPSQKAKPATVSTRSATRQRTGTQEGQMERML